MEISNQEFCQAKSVLTRKINFNEAASYDNMSSLEQEDGLELIELLAPEKGSMVLDLGCGTGFLSKALADLVGPEGKVVAIDPDLSRLQVAKSTYHASNLEFLEGAAENIPGTGLYDVVFSNYVLHWCKDKPKAFSQIATSLKPGGKFGFRCVTTDQFDSQFPLLSSRMQKVLADKLSTLDESELDKYAASNNLKEVYHSTHECEHKFKDLAEYRKFFHMHATQRKVSVFNSDWGATEVQSKDNLSFKYPILTSIMVKE